jgi:hypothetical protein
MWSVNPRDADDLLEGETRGVPYECVIWNFNDLQMLFSTLSRSFSQVPGTPVGGNISIVLAKRTVQL